MQNKKGNIAIIIVILVVLGLLVGLYLMKQNTDLYQKAQMPENTTAPEMINNASDLDKASKELDSDNVDQIDVYVNQNSSDSTSF